MRRVKYFTPPVAVAKEAAMGLLFRKLWRRGGTSVGIHRARTLKRRQPVTLVTIKKMWRFFNRHYKNRKTPMHKGNGQIAWLLWGGDPGFKWVHSVLKRQGYFDE